MSEFDEDNFERPKDHRFRIRRFRADMNNVGCFYDLYNGMSKYVSGVFDISEESAMNIISVESSAALPDKDLYENEPHIAREQMQLGLVRVVMPILIDLGIQNDMYKQWLHDSLPVAIDSHHDLHDVNSCTDPSPNSEVYLACHNSSNCPVKVVRQLLLTDVLEASSDENKDDGPWVDKEILRDKKVRALLKLEACKKRGLIQPTQAALLRSGYLTKYRNRMLYHQENKDI